ncbi:terminase small subunit [Caldifermentibacillus hisashii]|uniref:terminase small subunit n=1 Tax=Caldifermentibacillus hisashii TaxID=996558 RepID=UPI0030E9342B
MPNWDLIRQEYENSNITMKALAEKYGVKDSTLRSRKNREKWQCNATDKNATQRINVATKKQQNKTQKKNKATTKEPVIENDDLTDKQKLFCIYYIKYFNATKAYQKAYGCDYTTAMASGSRLLRNVKVSEEIDRLKAEQANELKLDVRDVLQKYIDIAFADITDFVEFGRETVADDETGLEYEVNKVKFKDSSEVDGTIITEVKQGKDGVSVKLADKMKALEMLSKYFDLLSENDKKRLQEEKLKAETAKAKAEAERLTKEDDGDNEEIIIVDEWSDDDDCD